MFPSSVERVPYSTARNVNEKIRRKTVNSIVRYAALGPEAIERRLVQLDREWDIERALEANFGSVMAITTLLGFVHDPAWFIVGGVAGAFMLFHALVGWCPPLPILRRLGFRTPAEIATERYALKALRGDFRDVPSLEQAAMEPALIRDVLLSVRRGGDRAMWEILSDTVRGRYARKG